MAVQHDKPRRLALKHVPLDPVMLATQHTARDVFVDGRHCTEKDLRSLAALPQATTLQITGLRIEPRALATVPWVESLRLTDPTTLAGLEELRQIRQLSVYHFPKIGTLSPIGSLEQLTGLLLSTPPGYDASRKCFEVESFDPLGRLEHLEQLTVRGVVPLRDGLQPLQRLKQLRHLTISHVHCFRLEDYARLARALPQTEGHCLQPFFAASWAGPCRRGCGQMRVVLTGAPPRRPHFLCPQCNQLRLEEHVAAWNAVAVEATGTNGTKKGQSKGSGTVARFTNRRD